jgi:hypothetical protein
MGVVSQLKVESLRIEESQMLASMLCHATMFVTPTEFHNLLTALQQRSWARMDRPAVLWVVKDVLSGEASAIQPQPNAATPSTLRKGSSFREQARARPNLQPHAPRQATRQARAPSPPPALSHRLAPALSHRLAPALTVRPTPVPRCGTSQGAAATYRMRRAARGAPGRGHPCQRRLSRRLRRPASKSGAPRQPRAH